MINILNSSLRKIGILNNIYECTEHQTLNSEYTLDFTCTAEKLKTELLYDKTNIIECDDNYYKVFNFDELHETGGLVTFTCSAEHIGYQIIQEIFEDGFKYGGTAQQIGQYACRNTRFNFTSDIEGNYTVDISDVTNARAVIDKLCILTAGEVKWDKFDIKLMQNIGQNIIHVEFGKNCSSIKRHVQFDPDKVTYNVDLIDCNDEATKELRKVHLGDTIIIKDKMLQTENVTKKVISLDIDKLANSSGNVTDETIESFDRTIPSSTVCVLGDKPISLIEEITKNVEVPKIQTDTVIEVITQEIVSAKVAMITNCWINELNVEYLETNFSDIDIRQPYPVDGVRNFMRIIDERMEHVTQTLSDSEVEDYKTKGGLQIYWTAINDAPQAYQFFTITEPSALNEEIKDNAPYKVKVRKVLKEDVKMSSNFEKFKDTSDIVPVMIFGAGAGDSQGNLISAPSDLQNIVGRDIKCGQGFIYKNRKGLLLQYISSTGKPYAILLGENGIESIGGFTSLDYYSDGFKLNGNDKYKWVAGGLQRMVDGKIIAITEHSGVIT